MAAMNDSTLTMGYPASPPLAGDDALFRKISWRILPLLLAGYVFAYLDRINIGFAALQMKADLGFSDAVYGLGAGIFFVGYILFEVPSNLLLQRIGVRKTLARIMILWGLTSLCMMFVHTPTSFYVTRVLLGICEAGFSPGVMLYLTLWYPQRRIGQMTALFLCGSTIAGAVGSPISGLIMDHLHEVLGLRNWQWLFLLESLPTVVLGIVILFKMADSPRSADWLSPGERQRLVAVLPASQGAQAKGGFREVLRDPTVYALAFTWFTLACGVYAVAFWLPMMLRSAGVASPSHIGYWSIIPYGLSAASMILYSRHSDRTGERRWHVAACALVGAVALALLPQVGQNPAMAVVVISAASIALFGAIPVLFAIPMTQLSARAAPGGIALINCIGVAGGFGSPFLLGWVKTATGSLDNGLYVISALLAIGAAVVLRTRKKQVA